MILLDNKRIDRTVKRMAYQILEEVRDSSLHLTGLNDRGYLLAEKLKTELQDISSRDFPLSHLNSDDDGEFQFENPVDNEQVLILIDDVIFSGYTMYRAIDKIGELSRFKKVFVVVLVDRGHRSFPIQAKIVGINVPTKLNEHVELKTQDGRLEEVVLTKK